MPFDRIFRTLHLPNSFVHRPWIILVAGGWAAGLRKPSTLNIRITLTLQFPWREVGKLNSALFFGSPISHAFPSFPRSVFICKLCGPLRIIVVLSQSGNVNNWINITAVINCWTQYFVRQSVRQSDFEYYLHICHRSILSRRNTTQC